jgi:hypothetical protein
MSFFAARAQDEADRPPEIIATARILAPKHDLIFQFYK